MDKYKMGVRIRQSIPFILVGTASALWGAVGMTAAAVAYQRRQHRAMGVQGRIADLLKEVLKQMAEGGLDSYTTENDDYGVIIMRQEK